MSVASSIQRELFVEQQARIESLVGKPSAHFRKYEAAYRKHTARFRNVISLEDVHSRISKADVVYIGDYHSLAASQKAFLQLAEFQARFKRPLTLALECIDIKHQASVDTFMKGTKSTDWLGQQLGHRDDGSANLWKNFAPVLAWARQRKIRVLGIDSRASGKHSLQDRDDAAARVIAAELRGPENPLVLVLMGQFHVAPEHLPKAVKVALETDLFSALTVYQNAEEIYWTLARSNRLHDTAAVEIDAQSISLISHSPIVAQRSFLDFAEAMLGEPLVEGDHLQQTFATVALAIAKQFGVDVRSRLKSLEVFTADTIDPLLARLKAHRLSTGHVRAIRQHILSQESAYLPAADAVYLSSFSLSHLSEEAAHFVRHVAVGDAMTRRRKTADAFWARCIEESIGFFGSKLVNPSRRSLSQAEWAAQFSSGSRENRRIAAFVLALTSSSAGDAASMIPLGDLELFQAVSHALGYLLGNALFLEWQSARFAPRDLKALLKDPLDNAAETWVTLTRKWIPSRRRNASTQVNSLTAAGAGR